VARGSVARRGRDAGPERNADKDLASAMAAPARLDGFQSRWTVVNGIQLHHRAAADGPAAAVPLVFVHGLAVSHRYMMPTARRLAAHHRVYLPDLPGFGLSPEPGWNLSLAEHADHLAGWLDALTLRQVALVGNSFGCQVAVDLAVRHPERVRSLVLVGPTTERGARTAGRQLARWLRDVRHEDLRQAWILARDVRDAGIARVAATFRGSLDDPIEAKLPRVAAPTLVVRGSLDPVVPQRWAETVTRLLPSSELVVVPGAPHNVNYAAADRLAPVVRSFLATSARWTPRLPASTLTPRPTRKEDPMAADRQPRDAEDEDARDAVAGDLEDELADPDTSRESEEREEGPQVSDEEGLP
jgi:pimeloyl-ACP methyl ester carboxylesterase